MSETTAAPARILSGMQPTGDSLHLGNYLGALVSWVGLQDEGFDPFYFVADLHSLTVTTDPQLRLRRSRQTAAQFIAGGVDPARSTLFLQSHVPEHAELGWVMNCLTAEGEARRMTQFKDKVAKGQDANVGLLTYPMLMAADILLYDASFVPVGDDQRQHLEITRDLAQRFNARYAETLRVPEPYIVKETARVMDLADPTRKMSKSTSSPKGLIDLMTPTDRLVKNIKSAVTDADGEIRYAPEDKPGVSNLLVIQSVLTGTRVEELERTYAGQGYGQLKEGVATAVVETVQPFQERMNDLLADTAELDRILAQGAERAREVGGETMARVRSALGLVPAQSR